MFLYPKAKKRKLQDDVDLLLTGGPFSHFFKCFVLFYFVLSINSMLLFLQVNKSLIEGLMRWLLTELLEVTYK